MSTEVCDDVFINVTEDDGYEMKGCFKTGPVDDG